MKEHIIIQYLKNFVRLFTEFEHPNPIAAQFYNWMLKRGKIRKTTPLTKSEIRELKHVLKLSGIRPQAKQCFYVSQMLLLSASDKFKYIEGFANNLIPVEHAWLEYKGKVVDVVWGSLEHNRSPDGFSADPSCEYFGVEIPTKFIAENISTTHMAETLVQKFFMKECGINR